jgi:uncharacterized membrane protein
MTATAAETDAPQDAVSQDPAPRPAARIDLLGLGLTVGGGAGLWAAFTLIVERIRLLIEPTTALSCDLNPVVSCGSVMTSDQASVFGFPNPLIGVVGFTVVTVTGVVLLAGARLPGWYWAGLQAGVVFAIGFIHWLIYNSLYLIGALCPYCLVVWVVVIPLFVAVTTRNLRAVAPRLPTGGRRVADAVVGRAPVLVVLWYLLIAALVLQRFWVFWRTQLS